MEHIPAIAALSLDDQRRLLDELWTRLAGEDAEVTPDDPVHSLIEERMAEYRADPTQASPWSEVRQRLRKAIR